MENSTFIQAYLLTFVVCVALTIGLILIINKGLKSFFNNLSKDNDIAKFFSKLTNIIIFLGGLSAALSSFYNTTEEANWLTLTWDIAEQFEESLFRLFLTLMILAITFFILHLIARRTNK
jgi:hypothetical protein